MLVDFDRAQAEDTNDPRQYSGTRGSGSGSGSGSDSESDEDVSDDANEFSGGGAGAQFAWSTGKERKKSLKKWLRGRHRHATNKESVVDELLTSANVRKTLLEEQQRTAAREAKRQRVLSNQRTAAGAAKDLGWGSEEGGEKLTTILDEFGREKQVPVG